ncbi:hypothetical protein JMN12_11880 [Capnocytophaga genosp. AHN8471]|uniref:hypothetical protein n=1 Tax=Capnocytophaga genosp. AHN8471 TaxID=327574 RepID=UPI0019344084|nr:hypothetical protein [Capnocytophaga genosp. AHN8471]MBM0657228.1 hypothetical protein [Capnocytophaga genosp. AHN8471]
MSKSQNSDKVFPFSPLHPLTAPPSHRSSTLSPLLHPLTAPPPSHHLFPACPPSGVRGLSPTTLSICPCGSHLAPHLKTTKCFDNK